MPVEGKWSPHTYTHISSWTYEKEIPLFICQTWVDAAGHSSFRYSVPASDEGQLKVAMRLLTPDLIESNLSSWLPTESVMVIVAYLVSQFSGDLKTPCQVN